MSSKQGIGQPARQLPALPFSCSLAPASSSASSCCCWAEAPGPKPSLRSGCSPDAAILAGHQSPPNSAGCKAPFQAGAAARRNLGSSPSDRQAAELVNSNYSRNCATNRMLRHGRNTPPLSVTDSAIAPSARMHLQATRPKPRSTTQRSRTASYARVLFNAERQRRKEQHPS